MKTTIKLSIFVLLLSLNSMVQAQTTRSIRFENGYVNQIRSGVEVNVEAIRLGGTIEFGLPANFGFETGLIYMLGFSRSTQYFPHEITKNINTLGHTLEIPIHATYRMPLFGQFKLMLFAGPSIDFGISQRQDVALLFNPANSDAINFIEDKANERERLKAGSEDLYKNSTLSRFNLLLGGGIGVQWKKYMIKGGYDFGLIDIDKTGKNSVRQGGWYTSLAFEL